MSEMTKTITFVGVALVTLIVAYAGGHRSSAELDTQTLVGRMIGTFNPDDAKRLKIVRFDEDTATLREFEVAEEDDLWVIPSKDGYPADAERQMGEATTSVLDREILAVESQHAADHEQYGVIDPLSPKLEVGQKNVGTRVTISDVNGDPLVDWIVGKPVKGADKQRYVREAGRDVVYVIEFDRDRLSTDFENWIEEDLLKINPWDIRSVRIKDYSAKFGLVFTADGPAIGVEQTQRGDLALRYDDRDSKWTVEHLRRFDPDKRDFADVSLSDDQQLNEDKLRELKEALDDLQIVDVARKPEGLSADLKAGEDFLADQEAARNLISMGFGPVQTPDGQREIVSSEGEIICTMKDGVEYVLRFGELPLDVASEEAKPSSDQEEASRDEGLNRYLFVMARFNEDAVERPELEEVPDLPEKAETPTGGDSDAADSPSDTEEVEVSEEGEGDEVTSTDQEVESSAEEDGETRDEELEALIAERKRIEEENQRKLTDYKDELAEGRERVGELNIRFGDWYYVVSNDVFKKVRLGLDDVIQSKSPEADGETADADDGDTSAFGAPGTSIPGLPNISGAVDGGSEE